MRKIILLVGIVLIISGIVFGITRNSTTEQAIEKEVAPVVKVTYLDEIDPSNMTDRQQTVLTVLKKEYAKSPKSYDGTVMKYTENFKESWCADFISWVFQDAGVGFVHPETSYWRIPGVHTLQSYYQQVGAYEDVESYTPKFGDVAFYFGETPDGSSAEHVAIVLGIKDGKVMTIGGNETRNGIMQIRSDKLSEGEKGLSGFGASGI